MNIKQHIEAGHYPICDQSGGWEVVLRNHTTAKVFTSKSGGQFPLVGVVSIVDRGWVPIQWTAEGMPERNTSNWSINYDLLPPPPRKVKVTPREAYVDKDGLIRALAESHHTPGDFPNWRVVTLTGEYEEPWS